MDPFEGGGDVGDVCPVSLDVDDQLLFGCDHGDHLPLALGVDVAAAGVGSVAAGAHFEVGEGPTDPYLLQTPPASVVCSWHS
jgi:hypothetical protein